MFFKITWLPSKNNTGGDNNLSWSFFRFNGSEIEYFLPTIGKFLFLVLKNAFLANKSSPNLT